MKNSLYIEEIKKIKLYLKKNNKNKKKLANAIYIMYTN